MLNRCSRLLWHRSNFHLKEIVFRNDSLTAKILIVVTPCILPTLEVFDGYGEGSLLLGDLLRRHFLKDNGGDWRGENAHVDLWREAVTRGARYAFDATSLNPRRVRMSVGHKDSAGAACVAPAPWSTCKCTITVARTLTHRCHPTCAYWTVRGRCSNPSLSRTSVLEFRSFCHRDCGWLSSAPIHHRVEELSLDRWHPGKGHWEWCQIKSHCEGVQLHLSFFFFFFSWCLQAEETKWRTVQLARISWNRNDSFFFLDWTWQVGVWYVLPPKFIYGFRMTFHLFTFTLKNGTDSWRIVYGSPWLTWCA